MSYDQPQRPTTDDRDAWTQYWAKVQPSDWFANWGYWRTEPEVDEGRQAFLRKRRAITPDIEHGIYPFRDENGSIKLTRADVEWLLAAHESGGMRGPVEWNDPNQQGREGLDLRGADLCQLDLSDLPLSRLQGGLGPSEWRTVGPEERELAAVHLEGTRLRRAHLEGGFFVRAHLEAANFFQAHLEAALLRDAHMDRADLSETHLEGARLTAARLQGANLGAAHLEGKRVLPVKRGRVGRKAQRQPEGVLPADLREAFFDVSTSLNKINFGTPEDGVVSVADVHWGGTNLAVVKWAPLTARGSRLGDERLAREPQDSEGKPKDRATRIREHEDAVRANRELATVLRGQGLNEEADRFAYRAQVLQRQVLRRQGQWGSAFGSWLLDLVAGHGYKWGRTITVYLLVVFGFAIAYWLIGPISGHTFAPDGALVFSVSSFHGRGFFPSGLELENWIARLAALEAVIGLFIEITFIATFTQRFFAR